MGSPDSDHSRRASGSPIAKLARIKRSDPSSVTAKGAAPLVTFEVRDADPEVLVVTNLWPRADDSAYGIFVKRQVDSLREAGVRVDVMFIRGYSSKRAYASAASMLAKLSRAGEPAYQLVHVHGGEAVLAAAAYGRVPVVASYLGCDLLGARMEDGRFTLRWRARRAILRRSSHLVSRTVTKSQEMEDALPRSRRARNHVVPSGVDDSAFVPFPRDEARRRLGWDASARIALFGANPRKPVKRFWLASSARDKATEKLGSIQLETLSGVEPADVPLMMNAADCLLLTSITEGSPNVVKEALMCGLPVVTTRVGDVEELLRDVSPSWICEASPDAIADALVECLRGPRRSNGRRKSMHLGVRPIAERILSVYATALSDASDDPAHARNGRSHAFRSAS